MKILALDISTKSTGIAVLEGNKLIHSQVAASGSANVYTRIQVITKRVEEIVKEYKPDKVIAEEPEPAFVKNNLDVFRKLTFAHGAICLMLNHYKLNMELCTSSHWRALVGIKTGRGITRAMLKPKDIAKAEEMYSIKCGDDEADAILIGAAYAKENGAAAEINFE